MLLFTLNILSLSFLFYSSSENEAALSNSHNDSMNGSNNSATVCGICLDEFALESLHVLKKCQCAFCRDVS